MVGRYGEYSLLLLPKLCNSLKIKNATNNNHQPKYFITYCFESVIIDCNTHKKGTKKNNNNSYD